MKHSIPQLHSFPAPPYDPLPTQRVTISYLWSRTAKVQELWEVVQAVKIWPGVTITPDSRGVCFALNDVSLGHLRWDARLELPFGPEMGERLLAETMARPDPDHPASGRIVFDVRGPRDVDHAVWLLRLAYLAPGSRLSACAAEPARPPQRI